MADFRFPRSFHDRGKTWHLLYSPDDQTTMLPSLDGGKVAALVVDPLYLPGRDEPIWVVRVDITLPSVASDGRMVGERHLRGIRTFAQRPVAPDRTPPLEMAFYLREPEERSGNSETQDFMLSLLGVVAQEQKPEVDRNWMGMLSDAQAEAGQAEGGAA